MYIIALTLICFGSFFALLGVGERVFAAIRMNWKFSFDGVVPVHLVPESFWFFLLCFGLLVGVTYVADRRWKPNDGRAHKRWLRYSKGMQLVTTLLLLCMFVFGFFVLT
jgi:hypothetical protein